MRILIVAPCVYPLGRSGYGGMERLVGLLGKEWVKLRHDVTVVAGAGSKVEGLDMLCGSEVGSFTQAEFRTWKEWGWLSSKVDITIDLSHSHYFRLHHEPGASWI